MSDTNDPQNPPAPQEIDPAALDDVVGAGVAARTTRLDEESQKVSFQESKKKGLQESSHKGL